MTDVHRLPHVWLQGKVIRKLCASWNTGVVAATTQGREDSRKIRFIKGLPQEVALCPRLYYAVSELSSAAPAGNGGIPVIR